MVKALFIEAGHGKSAYGLLKDVGACSRFGDNNYQERDIALQLARRVIAILSTKKELKDVLIQGVGVETAAAITSKMKFVNTVIRENRFPMEDCLGIAIHLNASTNSKPRGMEIWYQKNGKSKVFGEHLVRAWLDYKILPLRPVPLISTAKHRYRKLYIDDAYCPYVLIEAGFISNPEDVKAVTGDYDRVAECISHGIMEHLRADF